MKIPSEQFVLGSIFLKQILIFIIPVFTKNLIETKKTEKQTNLQIKKIASYLYKKMIVKK